VIDVLTLAERAANRDRNYAQQFERYTVTFTHAVVTDNAGDPCEYCGDEFAVNTRTVYGVDRETNEMVALDCCSACTTTLVVDYLDADQPVTVERLTFLPDDRMSGPDDTRPHPDGE